MFGFSLHLRKRFAREEEVRVEIVAHVGSIGEVTDSVGQFESAAQQINASPHVFRPAHDKNREAMMGARLIAFQSASFDELKADMPKSKSSLVVAEMRSGNSGEPFVRDTGCIAV